MNEHAESTGPPEGHEDIMDATYRALREHGFADLTMQDIADEAERSKSLLHYHYDTKQELLVAFLDYLVEQGKQRAADHEGEDPVDRLYGIVETFLVDADDDEWSFATAMLELRAQAPYEPAYREQLERNEAFMRDHVAGIVREGIEAGEFRDVDPERTARLVLAAVDGARTQRVVLADDTAEVVHEELVERVLEPLQVADGSDTSSSDGSGD